MTTGPSVVAPLLFQEGEVVRTWRFAAIAFIGFAMMFIPAAIQAGPTFFVERWNPLYQKILLLDSGLLVVFLFIALRKPAGAWVSLLLTVFPVNFALLAIVFEYAIGPVLVHEGGPSVRMIPASVAVVCGGLAVWYALSRNIKFPAGLLSMLLVADLPVLTLSQ